MRSFALLLILLMNGFWAFAQVHYYVRPCSSGSGSSWEDATCDLYSVLSVARSGDEIWVAAGTYTPSSNGDRNASFRIADGVRMYGGFTGTEQLRAARDWAKNPTILSGEIGLPGIDDNSYNVVFTQNAGPGTLVDGFVITGGNANGQVKKGSKIRSGGGWHDLASDGNDSEPVISNCTFLFNNAIEGGAFYANGINGSSNPSFKNCEFIRNEALLDGGAVYSDGKNSSANKIYLFNCRLEDNISNYGAGIFVENGVDITGLVVEKCVFKKNIAKQWGGGIFYNNSMGSDFTLHLFECNFDSNYPSDVNRTRFLIDPDQDLARR